MASTLPSDALCALWMHRMKAPLSRKQWISSSQVFFSPYLPVDWNTPGLHLQYQLAKASIMRSIFCASPGRRKLHRNCLSGAACQRVRRSARDFYPFPQPMRHHKNTGRHPITSQKQSITGSRRSVSLSTYSLGSPALKSLKGGSWTEHTVNILFPRECSAGL